MRVFLSDIYNWVTRVFTTNCNVRVPVESSNFTLETRCWSSDHVLFYTFSNCRLVLVFSSLAVDLLQIGSLYYGTHFSGLCTESEQIHSAQLLRKGCNNFIEGSFDVQICWHHKNHRFLLCIQASMHKLMDWRIYLCICLFIHYIYENHVFTFSYYCMYECLSVCMYPCL